MIFLRCCLYSNSPSHEWNAQTLSVFMEGVPTSVCAQTHIHMRKYVRARKYACARTQIRTHMIPKFETHFTQAVQSRTTN